VARPRSEDKRQALLAAAVRVITSRGLGAPTARIAQEAGVSNGTLFLYFPTKAALFNELYLDLKSAMSSASLANLPREAALKLQLEHLWSGWLGWAAAHPEERRALELLGVSDDLTAEVRQKGHELMTEVAVLLDRSRQGGPLTDAPLAYVMALMNAVAETTIGFLQADPEAAADHQRRGFEALWRLVA
jgi:AcrR family transcriptional regulator